MIQIYPLYRLQQVDSRIDLLASQASAGDGNAEIEKKIRVRERKLGEADKQLHALKTQLKDSELRLASIETHMKDIEKKLYSGSTSNTKELAGYNQELGILKGQKSTLEDGVLSLMEQVEAAAAEVLTLKGRIEKAKKELEEHQARHGATRSEALAQIDDLRKKRDALSGEIDASLLSRYEALRKRKDGVAVAKIDHNACQECGAQVTDAIKRRVQERQLELCSYCERILFTD
jgi:predicted  nucleic acid-binding Zn-ribbon protein